MRVPLLALLALFVVGVAHAQLNFGPHGLSSPPINIVTAYKFMRDLWYTVSGTGQKSSNSVKMASKHKTETRAAGRSDSDKDYDDDLNNIKSVILAANEAEALKTRTDTPEGPKRNRGTKLNGEKINTESPLTRAILLPKKKIVLGKWPIVYGVLNGLLLAAAIILAKPYFFTGETIVSKYEKDKEEKKKGGMHGKYSDEDMEEMTYAMTLPMEPSYGMPGTPMPYGPPPDLAEGQLSPMYSTHMMVVRDDLDEMPKLKYKLKGGMYEDSTLSSHYKLNGKSSEVNEVSILPPPALPQRLPPPPSQPLPQFQPAYGQPYPTGSKGGSKERKEDVPLNELHYYNPTVFVSDEPSSYACLERMVCMNPSRSGQVAEAKVAEAKSQSGEHVPNPAELNFMIRRLDQAAAFGANHGDCSQYFCPPQLPTFNQEQVGDQYSPPPAADRFSPDRNQHALPVKNQYAPPVQNQISPQLAANHFSLGPGNRNPQPANGAQFSPQVALDQPSQSTLGDISGSKEAKGDAFSIQQLQPVYQNENVQGKAPSIVTSQHVFRGQLQPSPNFGNDIHRTQKVEEEDVSEKVASTPAPPSKVTTPIRWIQAPRIQASRIRAPNYAQVGVETTESEEEAAYRQHPKNFLRRSSQPVASVIAVPVPGREVETTIIEPNRTEKSNFEPET